MKSGQEFTFLVHKNQLLFFFLCAKYGPKVNTISREYDKRVQQSFLFKTQGQSHPLKIENFLIKTFQKNGSLNLFNNNNRILPFVSRYSHFRM